MPTVIKSFYGRMKKSKIAVISALIIIIAAGIASPFLFFSRLEAVKTSPEGTVSSRTKISVKFNGEIFPEKKHILKTQSGESDYSNVSDIEGVIYIKPGAVEYFEIDPPVEGKYTFENKDTIVFSPDKPLAPSTEYEVKVENRHIDAVELKGDKRKKRKVKEEKFTFQTEPIKVQSANIFFNYDVSTGFEKEVVGEINFNYPVEPEELKNNVKLVFDGKDIPFNVENANVPNRFYVKSKEISRGEDDKKIRLTIQSGLKCIGGEVPLEKDYVKKITLAEKPDLEIANAGAFPVTGNTYLSVNFTMPVSSSQARSHIKVLLNDSSVPINIETEYCYAVIKGDFKPNRYYTVKVLKGLRSDNGEELDDTYEKKVYISDLSPQVGFISDKNILPSKGEMNIELFTLNLDNFNISVEKVFKDNLAFALQNRYSSRYSASVYYKRVQVVEGALNEKVKHYYNLEKLHDMEYRGMYKIKVYDPRSYYNQETKLVLCTDIGLVAKEVKDDLIVNAVSISDLEPMAGVTLKIMSKENQLMAQAETGADGRVVFEDYKDSKEHNFTPYIIMAEKEEDFSYLQFYDAGIATSRFNTGGQYLDEDKMTAFLTTERGVYRPGDNVYLSTLVRASDMSVPEGLPLSLNISDPRGENFFSEKQLTASGHGMQTFMIELPDYAKTGYYYATLKAGDGIQIGSYSFKVEEFIPDKIKTMIEEPSDEHNPGEPLKFKTKAVQLFGPPAAGYKVNTRVVFEPFPFRPDGYKDYTFSALNRPFYGQTVNLGSSSLDEKGVKEYSVNVPDGTMPPSMLKARIYGEVFDSGGRSVSASGAYLMHRYKQYYGIKLESEKDEFNTGSEVKVKCVAVDHKGNKTKAEDVKLIVKRKVYYTILKKYGIRGSGFESDYYEEVLLEKNISFDGESEYSFNADKPGEYKVYLGKENGMSTGKSVYIYGGGVETYNMEDAGKLSIHFDKESYNVGDTATVSVVSPIEGRLFFSFERDSVSQEESLMLGEDKKAQFTINVGEEHVPNMYVSALVVRKPTDGLKELPSSAFAVKPMEIGASERRIDIEIESAEETRSSDGINVKANLSKSSADSGVILFAVDEGILQITQFKTPDPFESFYAKRALRTYLYSIFDNIMPDVKAKKLAVGGDMMAYSDEARHLNPVSAKRVKPVAMFSDILSPDENGKVEYKFDLPDFNGRVRIMAIAADKKSFGSASKYVTVADPIVVTPSFPRFMAPKDRIKVPVQVYNKTGKSGSFTVTLAVDGPIKVNVAKQSVELKNKEQKTIYFSCEARNDAGKAVFTVTAQGGGEHSTRSVELPVRPARPLTVKAESGKIRPGSDESIEIPSGFIPYGQNVRISFARSTLIKYVRSLEYLINYPYGCLEQTVSSVFPALYMKELLQYTSPGSTASKNADKFIAEAVNKIEKMQQYDGRFVYWRGGNYVNDYASRYASHFLIEAEKMGYNVDSSVMDKVKEQIGAGSVKVKGRLDRRDSGSGSSGNIYELYLRALIGEPDKEYMDYIYNGDRDGLSLENELRLASAYAMIGEKEKAEELMPSEFVLKHFPRFLGGDFDSPLKRLSLYLSTYCDIYPQDTEKIMELAKELEDEAVDGSFGNTHENVLALIALSKAYGIGKEPVDASVKVDGVHYKDVNEGAAVISDNSLTGKTMTIINNSEADMYYSVIAEGTKLEEESESEASGMRISREYFSESGTPINLSSLNQGDRIVITLTLSPLNAGKQQLNNIAVVDMLPAGLEIENPRLRSSVGLGFRPAMSLYPANLDIRDDRLILFTGIVKEELKFSYVARAVTVGEFDIPKVYAEAMYDPTVRAVSGDYGLMTVVK